MELGCALGYAFFECAVQSSDAPLADLLGDALCEQVCNVQTTGPFLEANDVSHVLLLAPECAGLQVPDLLDAFLLNYTQCRRYIYFHRNLHIGSEVSQERHDTNALGGGFHGAM